MNREICYLDKNKEGSAFILGPAGEEDGLGLKLMYDCFNPKAVAQGLPPQEPDQCRIWVENLLCRAENLLAWQDERVVGHCALIPDACRNDAEYIIFVDKPYRNLGLGTALTRRALDRAGALGLKLIWLSVAVTNFPAVRLYRKFGFQFVDREGLDRTMHLKLEQ